MKPLRLSIVALSLVVLSLVFAQVGLAATGKLVSRTQAAEDETTWKPASNYYSIMIDSDGGREENLPNYILDVEDTDASYWVWETGGRGLILPSTDEAIAACWYSHSEFSMTVNVKDQAEHEVSLFLFDFDSFGPRQAEVTMVDAKTDKELDKQVVGEHIKPVTLTYSYQGSVKFIVKNIGDATYNVVLGGLFFSK